MANLLLEWPPSSLRRLRDNLTANARSKVQPRFKGVFGKMVDNVGTLTQLTREDVCEELGLIDPKDNEVKRCANQIKDGLEAFRGVFPQIKVELALELGYHITCSHPPPPEWVLKRTRPLGLIIANAADWFSGQLILGGVESCRTNGFDLVVDVTQDRPDAEGERLRAMLEKCEGVLMVPVGERLLDPGDVELLKAKLCVLVDRFLPGVAVPSVHNDDISGGRRAAEYLLGNACRRIIIVGQATDDNQQQKLTPIADREWGCKVAARGHDVQIVWEQPSGPNEEGGFQTLQKIDHLWHLDENDGIFALTDKVAIGCLHYLRSQGLGWSSKRIISFEGQSVGQFVEPCLASIRANPVEIGRRAAEVLIARIQSTPLPHTDCFPHYLVAPSFLVPSDDGLTRSEEAISYPDASDQYLGGR